eukprot:m.490908 g.490908  ORF g.490908 m.490908 type:complete len:248 (-) comp28820_c0_seq1:140-883(-)
MVGCTPRTYDAIPYSSAGTFRITTLDRLLWDVLWLCACLVLYAVFDVFVANRTKARWWLLHLFANVLTVYLALPDCWRCLIDPANAINGGDYSVAPTYTIASIHAYHLLAFRNLPRGDWVHHLLFGGTICVAGLLLEAGTVLSVLAFFLSGLPGGLDYAMLAAEKHGLLDRVSEKRWNARVNVWIRSPGCIFCAYTVYINFLYRPESPTIYQFIAAIIVGGLCLGNGQYYMQVVVGNTSRKVSDYSC